MAAISLLSSAAHANVATEMHGVTPTLAGWAYGRVPLELQAKGEAVDVSEYSSLRLALTVSQMRNRHGDENGELDAARLHVAIEHLTNGRWELLHTFKPMQNPSTQTATLNGFDQQVRASYYFARSNMPATITEEVAFTFELTGEAL